MGRPALGLGNIGLEQLRVAALAGMLELGAEPFDALGPFERAVVGESVAGERKASAAEERLNNPACFAPRSAGSDA